MPYRDMKFSLTGTVEEISVPPNDTTRDAIVLDPSIHEVHGQTVGATDDYKAGKDTCVKGALPGRDVVYALELRPKEELVVRLKSFAGAYPVFWLTTDPNDPEGCKAVTQGGLRYRNDSTESEHLYLVIDSIPKEGYCVFDL